MSVHVGHVCLSTYACIHMYFIYIYIYIYIYTYVYIYIYVNIQTVPTVQKKKCCNHQACASALATPGLLFFLFLLLILASPVKLMTAEVFCDFRLSAASNVLQRSYVNTATRNKSIL